MIRALRRHTQDRRAAGPSPRGGFTLIELVTVIVIVGIIMALVFSRRATLNGDLMARMSEVRAQVRFVQLLAMKSATNYLTFRSDGTNYWASYSGNNTLIVLPGERSATVSLAGKSMSMGNCTLSFDQYGIPYSGSPATKLTTSTSISITAGGSTGTLVVSPETGFVP